MRRRWLDREVRGFAVQDWAWTAADVALMHERLAGEDEEASLED